MNGHNRNKRTASDFLANDHITNKRTASDFLVNGHITNKRTATLKITERPFINKRTTNICHWYQKWIWSFWPWTWRSLCDQFTWSSIEFIWNISGSTSATHNLVNFNCTSNCLAFGIRNVKQSTNEHLYFIRVAVRLKSSWPGELYFFWKESKNSKKKSSKSHLDRKNVKKQNKERERSIWIQ